MISLRFLPSSVAYQMVPLLFLLTEGFIYFIRDFEKRLTSKLDRMPFSSFPWPYRITGSNCSNLSERHHIMITIDNRTQVLIE